MFGKGTVLCHLLCACNWVCCVMFFQSCFQNFSVQPFFRQSWNSLQITLIQRPHKSLNRSFVNGHHSKHITALTAIFGLFPNTLITIIFNMLLNSKVLKLIPNIWNPIQISQQINVSVMHYNEDSAKFRTQPQITLVSKIEAI